MKDEYKDVNREVKRQIRTDKRDWVDTIASEAETAANSHQMRTLYRLTNVLCNKPPKQSVAVEDQNGNLISGKEETIQRWSEHFKEVLNIEKPNQPINDDEVNEEHIDTEETNIREPSRIEIRNAIKQLKNGKASGIDSITAEPLKADIELATDKLKQLIDKIWKEERIPTKWKQGLIIKLPKKGNLKQCKNWRGITLLPITSKVPSRVIIDRIRSGVDKYLRNEQTGFRKGRGITEQIFTLRNIIKQANEWQATLYLNFIDFEKASDSVHRDSLWRIMRAYGIPEKLTNLVKAFYDDFKCAVIHQGETSEWFDIKTGVKQGCIMSGFLFLMMVDWVLRRTVRNGETGIRWKFTSKLDDLDFADDLVLTASTKQNIQLKTDRLCRVAQRVGLKVNSQKTKVMRINSRNDDRIYINGEDVEDVDKFVYLGATLTKSGAGMGDMENRISKWRNAYRQLTKIWNSHKIKRSTKLKLYKSLVLSVLLYGSETWKMTKGDKRKLNTFQTKCLRRIMKIKWQEHISNEELLIRT